MSEFGKVLFGGFAAYAVLVIGIYLLQRTMMYVPDTSFPSREQAGVPEMEAVQLATEDGLSLLSWYRAAEKGRPTLVYFHGNGGNIQARGWKVRPYLDAGFGVFLLSYRGYGGNEGTPSEEGLYADGRAALAFLEERGVTDRDLVLYGESLGSGIAVHLARERAAQGRPAGSVILEAPFLSMAEAAQHHYFYLPARWLVKDRYDSVSKIGEVSAPLLVVHGDRDRVVPIEHGKALLAEGAKPKKGVFVTGGGHQDLESWGLSGFVMDFLETSD